MFGMKCTIIFLLFVFAASCSYARPNPDVACHGFPIYPASAASDCSQQDADHYTSVYSSFAEADEAAAYLDDHAKAFGWKRHLRDMNTVVYVRRKENESGTVKVLFHKPGTLLAGNAEPFAQGAVEYFFSDANTKLTFHVTSIVTRERPDAVDAYMKIMAKVPFAEVAAARSESAQTQSEIVADPVNETVTAREVKRLATGQYTDIFQREDGMFCIVRLDRVTKAGVEVAYRGEDVVIKDSELVDVLSRIAAASSAMQDAAKAAAAVTPSQSTDKNVK
jgi:hypothetical protein